jgi:hypothetical protein
MKHLVYIFLFFGCFASAQNTASNNPALAKKLLDSFGLEAEMRGIETRERIGTIDKILFLPGAKSEHWHNKGICTITLDSEITNEYELQFKAYHELGHHLGLNHCLQCTYNIMVEIRSGKTYIFDEKPIRSLYLDLFFEAIRNPKNYNEGHTHY